MDIHQGDWWAQGMEEASLGKGPRLSQDPPGCTSEHVLPKTNLRPGAQASQNPKQTRAINLSLAAGWRLNELAEKHMWSKGSGCMRSQPVWEWDGAGPQNPEPYTKVELVQVQQNQGHEAMGLAQCHQSLPKWLWAGLTSRPDTQPSMLNSGGAGALLQPSPSLCRFWTCYWKGRWSLPKALPAIWNWVLDNNFIHFPSSLPVPGHRSGSCVPSWKASLPPSGLDLLGTENLEPHKQEEAGDWGSNRLTCHQVSPSELGPQHSWEQREKTELQSIPKENEVCFFPSLISIFIASLLFALPAHN